MMDNLELQQQLADKLSSVQWHGRYFSCICPFHDDREPSLLVYPDGAHCQGCHAHSSLERLEKKIGAGSVVYKTPHERQDVSGVPHWIVRGLRDSPSLFVSSQMGIDLHSKYLLDRGVTFNTIEELQIKWAEGWFIFPLIDYDGEITGGIVRIDPVFHAGSDIKVRYATIESAEKGLYIPNWNTVLAAKSVAVVFGTIDAVLLAQDGFPVVTPPYGLNARPERFSKIRSNLIVIPDRGEEWAASKLAYALDWRGEIHTLPYPNDSKDVADMYAYEHNRKILRRCLRLWLK